ncbi:MAG TPA: hypothetical protein VGP25_18630 [Gemmatimonadaceae bacterium]|jgi:hypothetical protein|nr:hypothetical protein [Gemmatimonadaceae bacterium]
MRTRPFARLVALSALAASAACSGSDIPAAPPQSRADLNLAFVELGSSAIPAATTTIAGVPAVAPSIGDRSACVYTASSQRFICPTRNAGGLTIDGSYALLTAAGSPQSAFDPASTSAVRTDVTVVGTVSDPATRVTIDAKQTLTLSGLLTGIHVLDGTATSKVTGTVVEGSTSVPITSSTTTTISKLVMPHSSSPGRWPVSGTITSENSTSLSGLPPVQTRIEITFDGTGRGGMIITVAGVTKRCAVDLATQGPTCS